MSGASAAALRASTSFHAPPLSSSSSVRQAAPSAVQFIRLPSSFLPLRANLYPYRPSPSPSPKRTSSFLCSAALTPALKTTLDKVVTSSKVVLFMKGTKDFPQCGFSNTVVQILKSYNVPFETINILENETLRQGLKEYSSWPTFPQLYIDGEFFGGCDITVEAFQNGELQEVLEKAMCS